MINRLAVQHVTVAHEAPNATFDVKLTQPKHHASITVVGPSKNLVQLQCWSNRDSRHPLTTTLTVEQIKKGMVLPFHATPGSGPISIKRIMRQANGTATQDHSPKKRCVRRPFSLLSFGKR